MQRTGSSEFQQNKAAYLKKSLRCFKVSSDGDLLLRNYLETRKSIQFILRKITTAVAFRLYIVRQIPTLIIFLSEDVFLCLLFIISQRESAKSSCFHDYSSHTLLCDLGMLSHIIKIIHFRLSGLLGQCVWQSNRTDFALSALFLKHFFKANVKRFLKT